VSVLPANIQDRDGTRDLLRETRRRFPFIERIFADAGYQGPKMTKTIAATGCWKIEIVKRSDLLRFVVLPKRWIVERTFAWISRNRRLTRDFERYAGTVAAFVRLAMIRIMLKREWKKRGGYAVSFRRPPLKRPSKTATLAWSTRCAPLGDQRIWRRLLKRRFTKALAVDSARELETGRRLRYRSA